MPANEPRRILVVNANWVGDALFSTPAIRAIKRHDPSAEIHCLGPERIAPVLRRNPHLDGFIAYDDRLSLWDLSSCLRLAAKLRALRFDTAYLFHRSKTKALLTKWAGIPRRVGYEAPRRSAWLTEAVKAPVSPQHRIDHYLNLVEKSGVPSDGRHMDFVADPDAQASLDRKLAAEGVGRGERYAVIHAGGNWSLKRWPASHFAESARAFVKELGTRVLLCGTSAEASLAEEIRAKAGEGVLSLAGKTTFDELALLLRGARFVLSNDSGPIHLAAAQKAKVIGLFGPTAAALTGPVSLAPSRILSKDVGCAVPCYFGDCSYRVCMEWLTPEEVVGAARELLNA